MIADRRPVLIVERVTVRCDECPRQASLYASNNKLLGQSLEDIGWTEDTGWTEDGDGFAHHCPEHSS